MQQNTLGILEAAQIAHVHPDTIRRAVLRRDLPHFRVAGGRICILPDALAAYLLRQQSSPSRFERGPAKFRLSRAGA